jgi:two-component system, NarL family, sensor histidine kinase DesK
MNDRTPADPADAHHGRRRGFGEWWHLIYLGTLLFQPAFVPDSTARDWIAAGALAAIGAVVYVIGERRQGAGLVPIIVTFTLLGIGGVWINGGVSVFFVYAAAYAGTIGRRAEVWRWLTGLTVTMVVLVVASPIPMPYRLAAFAFPLAFVWIIGYSVMVDADRAREAERLRIDNARIERLATLGERERIARDLHDLLGHTLTGIVVRAQLISRVAGSDPAAAAREAADVEQIARSALAEVRAAVTGWRHHALDAESDVARDVLTAAGVDLVHDQDADMSMSPAVEAAVALAVREAVTNVVRHAAADVCRIGIVAAGDHVRLTVSDDGRGTRAPDGSGLTGMRERIIALGGQVERSLGHGTTLTVTVPAQEVSA